MHLYKGLNPDSGQKTEKEFHDDYKASEYAKENNINFPNWQVVDLSDGSLVDSNEMHQNEINGIIDDMFPDQDGEFDLD